MDDPLELIKQAYEYLKKNELEQCVITCNQIIYLDAQNEEAILCKGECLFRQDKYDESLAEFTKFKDKQISKIKVRAILGEAIVLQKQGKFSSAWKRYSKVLQQDASNLTQMIKYSAITGRALCKQELKIYHESLEDLESIQFLSQIPMKWIQEVEEKIEKLEKIIEVEQQYIVNPKQDFEKEFGQYSQIDSKDFLGKGSEGKVYKVKSELDKKDYAVKIQDPQLIQNDDVDETKQIIQQIDQQLNEVKLMQEVDHDNIIKYQKFFYFTHKNFIIMAYKMEKADSDLKKQIEKRFQDKQYKQYQTAQNFKKIAEPICQALHFLAYQKNDKKIFHFDIKPANILIYGDKYKIADFGMAQTLNNDQVSITFKTLGTPTFLSPELRIQHIIGNPIAQIRHDEEAEKSDIFSLGLTLLQDFCFDDTLKPIKLDGFNKADGQQLIDKIINQIQTNQDPKLEKVKEILSGMLQHNPANRFNYQQIIQRLNQL